MFYCLLCHTRLTNPIGTFQKAWCKGCEVWIFTSIGEFPPVLGPKDIRLAGKALYPPKWWLVFLLEHNLGRFRHGTAAKPMKVTA